MAISRLTETTLQAGLPKFDTFWDGRSAVGSMEPISAITLSATQPSVEFNNIPGTYSHLQIRALTRASSTGANNYVRFNNDTGSNYAFHALYGDGSSAAVSALTSQAFAYAGYTSNSSISANVFSVIVLDILDYANINKNKTLRTLNGFDANGSGLVHFASGLWQSTSAINSLTFYMNTGSFVQYSSFTLYGIK